MGVEAERHMEFQRLAPLSLPLVTNNVFWISLFHLINLFT